MFRISLFFCQMNICIKFVPAKRAGGGAVFSGRRDILLIFHAKLISVFCIFTIASGHYYHRASLRCKTRIQLKCIIFNRPHSDSPLKNRAANCAAVDCLIFAFRMVAIFIRHIHCFPFDKALFRCYIRLNRRGSCCGEPDEGGNHPTSAAKDSDRRGDAGRTRDRRDIRDKSKN